MLGADLEAPAHVDFRAYAYAGAGPADLGIHRRGASAELVYGREGGDRRRKLRRRRDGLRCRAPTAHSTPAFGALALEADRLCPLPASPRCGQRRRRPGPASPTLLFSANSCWAWQPVLDARRRSDERNLVKQSIEHCRAGNGGNTPGRTQVPPRRDRGAPICEGPVSGISSAPQQSAETGHSLDWATQTSVTGNRLPLCLVYRTGGISHHMTRTKRADARMAANGPAPSVAGRTELELLRAELERVAAERDEAFATSERRRR